MKRKQLHKGLQKTMVSQQTFYKFSADNDKKFYSNDLEYESNFTIHFESNLDVVLMRSHLNKNHENSVQI